MAQQNSFYSLSTAGGVSGQAPKDDEAVNSSCNHNGSTSIFNMPECVIDVYLGAINGGTSRDEKFRSISCLYSEKYDQDSNCNYNPKDDPPCGCCSINEPKKKDPSCCEEGDPYDKGFNDKKRDHTCACSSPEARRSHRMGKSNIASDCPYQTELANKKGMDVCGKSTASSGCDCECCPYANDLIHKKRDPSCGCCNEVPDFKAPLDMCPGKSRNTSRDYITCPDDVPNRSTFYSEENSYSLMGCHNNSCSIDLVYGYGLDHSTVAMPSETSYFHSSSPDIVTSTFPARIAADFHLERDVEPEDDQPRAALMDAPVYTTAPMESDVVDHLSNLAGGRRWAVKRHDFESRPSLISKGEENVATFVVRF